MPSQKPDPLAVQLESPDFPCESLRVRALTGREAISQLFSFDIELVSVEDPGPEIASMVGATAAIVFLKDGIEARRTNGMITEARDVLDVRKNKRAYRIRLVPSAYRLALVEAHDTFWNKALPDILQQKLDLVALAGDDLAIRLVGTYAPRALVVQYQETDLAFLSRITGRGQDREPERRRVQ